MSELKKMITFLKDVNKNGETPGLFLGVSLGEGRVVIMTHRLSVLDRVLMIQELIIDARKLLNHPGLDMPHREEQLVALDRAEKELGLSSRRTES